VPKLFTAELERLDDNGAPWSIVEGVSQEQFARSPRLWPRPGNSAVSPWEGAMCHECLELDVRIDHYGVMGSRVTDQALLLRIKELIDLMQDLKVALHPQHKMPQPQIIRATAMLA
jgi:hypothetical protein